MAQQVQHEVTILRRKQVEQRIGLSRSTLYQRIADGTFPPPVSLGTRSVGWIASEIDDWLARRVAARDGAAR